MHNRNIIVESLKESFLSIWKNKSLFLLLFFLQIAFLIVFSAVNYTYQARMLTSAMAITDYLGQQKLDEASVASNILNQKSILGDDSLSISRNFDSIVKNFRIYLIYIFVLMAFFISTAWSITHKLIHKNSLRNMLSNFLKTFVVLIFYLGLIFAFFFSVLNVSFAQIAVEGAKFFAKYVAFLVFSIVLLYFMFISLSLINKEELKDIVQKTLMVGIKKAHYMLPVYSINVLIFLSAFFLFYYFIEISMIVLFLSLMLIIFSFVFARIFIVNAVERLE